MLLALARLYIACLCVWLLGNTFLSLLMFMIIKSPVTFMLLIFFYEIRPSQLHSKRELSLRILQRLDRKYIYLN